MPCHSGTRLLTRWNLARCIGMAHDFSMKPPPDLEPMIDSTSVKASIGDVLRDRRQPDGIPVDGLLPGGFPAYARILHPAWADAGHVRWGDIAAETGAGLEEEVPFRHITVRPGAEVPLGPQGAWNQDEGPDQGTLPREECSVLVELLRGFTSTLCWFLVWNGWSGLKIDPRQVEVPWLYNPYLVFRGPLDAVTGFDWSGTWQTPHLWFVDDRRWGVATEIDDNSTHVGGPQVLIDAILASERLESLPTRGDALAVRTGEWLMP